MALSERLITYITSRRPPDAQIKRRSGDVNVYRWWLFRSNWLGIYLHNIVRKDEDNEPHDHPGWNITWVLRGWYTERTYKNIQGEPWYPSDGYGPEFSQLSEIKCISGLKVRNGWMPHKIEEVSDPSGNSCWTLWIVLRAQRPWGFWCKNKGWVHQAVYQGAEYGTIGKGCD
jgi:hypothetical protein